MVLCRRQAERLFCVCGPRRARGSLSGGSAAGAAGRAVQVEVKLRLADKAAHDKFVELLAAGKRQVWEQENFFFDGENAELSSQRHVLRVRIYNETKKALVTIKGKVRSCGARCCKHANRMLDGRG